MQSNAFDSFVCKLRRTVLVRDYEALITDSISDDPNGGPIKPLKRLGEPEEIFNCFTFL